MAPSTDRRNFWVNPSIGFYENLRSMRNKADLNTA